MGLIKWLKGFTFFNSVCCGSCGVSHQMIKFAGERCPLFDAHCYIKKLDQANAELSRALYDLKERCKRPARSVRVHRRCNSVPRKVRRSSIDLLSVGIGAAAGFVARLFLKGESK